MLVGLIFIGVLYMCLLFFIANKAEKLNKPQWLSKPSVFVLIMAVFCTTWTYYGSVGRAATHGIDFLAIYLGPTIILAVGYGMQRKIFSISKELHITSLADFISIRFGKNFTLGALVTICCIVGLIPYIGLQLKAIVNSLEVFIQSDLGPLDDKQQLFSIIAIGTTIILCVFSILYGARKLESSEKHTGLMAVIAFESVIKLIIVLIIGVIITFVWNDGFADIISKTVENNDVSHLFTLSTKGSYTEWIAMLLLSGIAFILLPRQFHISYIENTSVRNLKQATWLFPLYLIAITIFILPIAFYGTYLFDSAIVDPDMYMLAIPISKHQHLLSMLAWLGGLSAGTSMIILETIALSIMVSNNIVAPLFFASNNIKINTPTIHSKQILNIRKLSIVIILALSLSYYLWIGQHTSLVSIGLISFGAIANFAPVLLLCLYWKGINSRGAIAGITVGFVVWFYTSVIPQATINGTINSSILTEGLWGINALKPYALFGLEGLDPLAHSLFWSLLSNTCIVLVISFSSSRSRFEVYYAELFVDNERFDTGMRYAVAWKGKANIDDLYRLLAGFIGMDKAQYLINEYANQQQIDIQKHQEADIKLVVYTERILGGIIGASSARILMKRSTNEEEISYREMFSIIKENQQVKETNKLLKQRSKELQEKSLALKEANEHLKRYDQQKNEFLYTVTHELKTPLTSIIALSEIVHDNPDLPDEQKSQYLSAVINEANRLSYLISQVLKIEKFEAGKQRLVLQQVDLGALIQQIAGTFEGTLQSRNLKLEITLPNEMLIVGCDYDMITQVLVNLIGNAIKFAHQAIFIKVYSNSYDWEVWISDDGKGIPVEDQELIFDKFFQAKNQHIKKPEGSGLGLAICKKIIDLHNGTIRVDNTNQVGAHIVFTLPKDEEVLI